MKPTLKIQYNDSEEQIAIRGYGIDYKNDIISIDYNSPTPNLSGFKLYNPDGSLMMDCSDYTYRWDVLEDPAVRNCIYYTNNPENVQTEPFPAPSPVEEEPLPEPNIDPEQMRADIDYIALMCDVDLGEGDV